MMTSVPNTKWWHQSQTQNGDISPKHKMVTSVPNTKWWHQSQTMSPFCVWDWCHHFVFGTDVIILCLGLMSPFCVWDWCHHFVFGTDVTILCLGRHQSQTQNGDISPKHKMMTSVSNTKWWHQSQTQNGDISPKHKMVTSVPNTSRKMLAPIICRERLS
jgi:hypothetical protein